MNKRSTICGTQRSSSSHCVTTFKWNTLELTHTVNELAREKPFLCSFLSLKCPYLSIPLELPLTAENKKVASARITLPELLLSGFNSHEICRVPPVALQ